ncbi:hypothetical protein FJZ17_02230 [Candidatus Pacearchaeota archaeon]|nr:hypothetical protein [Candidatus Pacearchaeota archaeon]
METPTLFELYSRLEKSEVFKKFKAEYPNSFFCAGFFILNFKSDTFEYSLDYREDKNIFTFKIPLGEGAITLIKEDILDTQKPLEQISSDVKVDLPEVRGLVEQALRDNNIKNKLEEVIAVLQLIDNQKLWNLTCMCEGFTIISMHIHSETQGILKFEKRNLLDFVKMGKKEDLK